MKRPTQDPEALLATLVRASRATPTAEQAQRLERRLSPWLDGKPGIARRPLYIAAAALAVVGLGILVQAGAESDGSVGKRDASAPSAGPRATFVRYEAPTAPERGPVETSPAITARPATKAHAVRPTDELSARVVPPPEAPSVASAEPPPAPDEAVPSPLTATREPEVDFLRRAQAALASSPSDALKMADDHPAVYPRGVLAQEREVIAIDALVRLGQRAEAKRRTEAFRSAFPRSAHLSRLAALTEKP